MAIANAWTVTKLSSDLKKATVKVKFDLIPNQGFSSNVTVNCRLTEPAAGVPKPRVFEAKKDVQLRSKSPVDLQIKIDNPKLWQPWEQGTPYLHTMVIEVKRGSQILDRHIAHVAFGKFHLMKNNPAYM